MRSRRSSRAVSPREYSRSLCGSVCRFRSIPRSPTTRFSRRVSRSRRKRARSAPTPSWKGGTPFSSRLRPSGRSRLARKRCWRLGGGLLGLSRLPCGVHTRTREGDAPCARLAGQVRHSVHTQDEGGGVGPCGEVRHPRRYRERYPHLLQRHPGARLRQMPRLPPPRTRIQGVRNVV